MPRGNRLALALSGASGAIYGLSLARFLFESDPQRLGLFGAWPVALALAAVALAAAVGIGLGVDRQVPPGTPSARSYAPLGLALPLIGLLAPDVNLLRSGTLLVGGAALLAMLALTPSPSPEQKRLGRGEQTEDGADRGSGQPRDGQPPHSDGTDEAAPQGLSRLPFLSLFLFLSLFILYIRTLAPAVGQADTFEFQVDVARLGIAHGSGYPLLMLVGRLFTLLPVGGTLAYRANLSSAFFAALAAVGVERLARRLGASPLVALLGGLAFGVSPTLWSRAVEIEVFDLNAAFVAAILYLCLDLLLSPPLAPKNLQRRLMLLWFLFGLSLTNHLTTLFLGPACLLAAAIAIQRLRAAPQPNAPGAKIQSSPIVGSSSSPSSLVPDHLPPANWAGGLSLVRLSSLSLLALLLGLSVYLYLPIRWPAVNGGQPLSLAGFANILTGNEAKGAFNWRLPFEDAGRYPIVWSKIVREYGWAGVALAVLGVAGLLAPGGFQLRADALQASSGAAPIAHAQADEANVRQRRPGRQLPITNYQLLILLALTCAGYAYFELAFNVPDPSFSAYIIPLHLIAALLMALGVQWFINLIASWRPRLAGAASAQPLLICATLCGFALLPMRSIWQSFGLVDRSGNWAAQQFGQLMLSQPLAHGAAILADSDKIAPLDYLQIAEGQRPDLDIIVLPDEASYRAALDERLAAGQVVYLGRYLPGIGARYSLRSVGPLAEVSDVPFTSTLVATQPPLAQPNVAAIHLVGYAQNPATATLSVTADAEIDLTLVWQAKDHPTDNLLVNLRLVDAAGQVAWQSAGSVPVSSLYPTNAWRAGEFISDFYRLPVEPALAPGQYQLQVALLPPFAAAPASAWTAVAPVMILPTSRSPGPPHLLRDQLGSNWLLGYDLPQAVAPGSHYSLTLYWLRNAQTMTVAAMGESHSLAAWPVGAVVPVVYHLTAPASGDSIQLSVDNGQRARCGWLAPETLSCPLPAIQLAGQAAAEGAVNFDNQILLNKAELGTHQVTPGGNVVVNLEWQALRALGADYTVFVHLLGPDGFVYGQVDSWPVSGTRATSGWAPGERIADTYNVRLPADAPPGPYHVEIGLYLLATGQRLPVVNADGQPVDDKLLLDGLQVNQSP